MNDPWFRHSERRVRLADGREGTECRAPIDSLWSITLDDGEVLYRSVLDGAKDRPTYTYIDGPS